MRMLHSSSGFDPGLVLDFKLFCYKNHFNLTFNFLASLTIYSSSFFFSTSKLNGVSLEFFSYIQDTFFKKQI